MLIFVYDIHKLSLWATILALISTVTNLNRFKIIPLRMRLQVIFYFYSFKTVYFHLLTSKLKMSLSGFFAALARVNVLAYSYRSIDGVPEISTFRYVNMEKGPRSILQLCDKRKISPWPQVGFSVLRLKRLLHA